MSRLASRLVTVEWALRPRGQVTTIEVYWHDELVKCELHPACGVEVTSGKHHRDLIRLGFFDEPSV